ncbi:MAG: S-layer homology domain-containing protein [Lachnospiraceae bacterium]|nr:S-layer homology domain-containing protein [Lachnospiraceae bacterium]
MKRMRAAAVCLMASIGLCQSVTGLYANAAATQLSVPIDEESRTQEIVNLQSNTPLLASNINRNNYTYYWSQVMNSYLTVNPSGGYTRVQYADGYVYIEDYNSSFVMQSSRKLQAELPKFGGFYNDGSNYYLVFGQENPQEDDNLEVIRVVKYSHQWDRLDVAAVRGANTTVPFDAGNLRMISGNGALYIRTSHEMYKSNDGYNHQSCMTIKVQLSDMTIADIAYEVQNSSAGYVSHSFNQFIKLDGGNLITLDHGDAYPRSAVLSKYKGDKLGVWGGVSTVSTLTYYGNVGANYTDATLGGFEISDTAYLTAGSSGPQNGSSGGKNIYVTATLKNNFTNAGTTFIWITHHASATHTCSNPQLVEISKTKYLLMWEEKDSSGTRSVKYVFLNGNGSPETPLFTGNANLSDCQPIYHNGKVVWYVTDGSSLKFYRIDTSNGTLTEGAEADEPTVPTVPTVPGWPFVDVEPTEGSWKYENVKYVYENNLMGGIGGSNQFQPDSQLTRAMFATVLHRMAGQPGVSYTAKFSDVPAGQWYTNAILWASETGIVNGYMDGRYGINDNITREQIAKMLYIYGEKRGYNVSGRTPLTSFMDLAEVSHWGVEYIQWAVNAGMISGKPNADGSFRLDPKGQATRAECAKMLRMFQEKYQ